MNTKKFVKESFIKDLQVGDFVSDLFLLSAAQQLQAKNGPYWRLEFTDTSGKISGKIWSPLSAEYPHLEPGQIIFVAARVSKYKDTPEFAIESLYVLDDEERSAVPTNLFLPCSPFDPQSMFAELEKILAENLSYKPWHKFTKLLFAQDNAQKTFMTSPAAKYMHHAYRSGLLEHTLSVCKLCLLICQNYPQVDKQVILIGALCHDFGKIWELEGELNTEYSQQGKLLGHIFQGLEKMTPLMQKAGVDSDLIEHAQHLILSHHGSLEFGSPKLPSTAEAYILHYADDLDSKLQQVTKALSDISPEETGWSPYISALGRSVYKATSSPSIVSKEKKSKDIKESKASPNLLEQICLLPLKE